MLDKEKALLEDKASASLAELVDNETVISVSSNLETDESTGQSRLVMKVECQQPSDKVHEKECDSAFLKLEEVAKKVGWVRSNDLCGMTLDNTDTTVVKTY